MGGGLLQGPQKIIRSLCRRDGVRYFRFHALRRSGASVLDSLNVPLGTIQRLLGHENRAAAEIYLHSPGKLEIEVVKLMELATESQKSHKDSLAQQSNCLLCGLMEILRA